MDLRLTARLAGLLGGTCWLVLVGLGGREPMAGIDLLGWAGVVLLTFALAVLGAGLVSSSAIWLRVIVAVAFPLLVASVLELMQQSFGRSVVEGSAGVVAVVMAGVGLTRSWRARGPAPTPGAHAAHRPG